MSRHAPALETLFTGGFVTVIDSAGTMVQADVGKAVELEADEKVKLISTGAQIFGRLHSIDPKGDDVVVVQIAGYVPLPVVSADQATVAVGNAVTGYVLGGTAGEVRHMVTATIGSTASVLEIMNQPKKIVDVQSSGAVVVVDLGAKIS